MGQVPGGGWSTETLRDLDYTGGGLFVYCANRPHCGRQLECNMYDLTIWLDAGSGSSGRACRCGAPGAAGSV